MRPLTRAVPQDAQRAMARDARWLGPGLSHAIFELTENFLRARGAKNFRMDTYSKNVIMRHLLEKHGFSFCGTLFFSYYQHCQP